MSFNDNTSSLWRRTSVLLKIARSWDRADCICGFGQRNTRSQLDREACFRRSQGEGANQQILIALAPRGSGIRIVRHQERQRLFAASGSRPPRMIKYAKAVWLLLPIAADDDRGHQGGPATRIATPVKRPSQMGGKRMFVILIEGGQAARFQPQSVGPLKDPLSRQVRAAQPPIRPNKHDCRVHLIQDRDEIARGGPRLVKTANEGEALLKLGCQKFRAVDREPWFSPGWAWPRPRPSASSAATET